MYKVIIVDDENIIVEGLKKVVDWKKYNCEVVATAHDAISGANKIRSQKPDILFTDIKMPNKDGLKMVAGLKGEFPDMQITVLTGYRDFSYAQQAINLGVTRFLLKPSKMSELEQAVEVMTTNLKNHNIYGTNNINEPQPKSEQANNFIVNQAVSYIEENYNEKISLNDVAESCYVSQWHLSKLMNKHLNKTFYDILNTTRIRKAKELLRQPNLRISDIAERIGYTDTAHFSRVFKKIEDIAPQDYRNKL